MFGQTFVDGTQNTNKKYTVALSLTIQMVALSILVLIPLVYTEGLPSAQLKSFLVAPAPPPAPTPKPIGIKAVRTTHRIFSAKLIAPRVIPRQVNPVQDTAPAPDIGVSNSTGDANNAGGVPYGLPTEAPTPAPPPPPRPVPKPRVVSTIRVGGNVAEANLIRRVQPVYPALAKSARVSGSVEFTAIISKEGAIENLQLVRGHPLLVNAAREAVLQWRYRPTMLNGEPVEVVTDITVNFLLSP